MPDAVEPTIVRPKTDAKAAMLIVADGDARAKIETWRRDHNGSRPHTSLGWMTPVEYAAAAATKAAE